MIAFFLALVLKVAAFACCYTLIRKYHNLAIIDIFWGLSFVPEILVAFLFYGINPGNGLYILMMLIWSARLSYYLGMRLKEKKTDRRYQEFSSDWPEAEFDQLALKKVVIPQGVVSLGMGLCSYLALFSSQKPPASGLIMWSISIYALGFFIEAVADGQLSQFKKRGRPECYTGGLWSFVRYPNYLGEILIWFGFAMYALGKPFGFLGLISPMMISYFLIKVTGIPYLEPKRANRETYPNPRPKYFLVPYIF